MAYQGTVFNVAMLLLVAQGTVATADTFDKGSFGAMPGERDPMEDPTNVAVNAPDTALTTLGELGSFPIKVHNSESMAKAYWTDDIVKSFVPAPTVKQYKIGACSFEIKTGAISARQYTVDAQGSFVVLQDAMASQTTLLANKDTSLFVSVTSELFASPLPGSREGCKATLKDKRKRLGTIDMEETSLSLAASDAQRVPTRAARPSTGTIVFLAWDDDAGGLKLEDKAGLAPGVESSVFELKTQAAADLYLDVLPKLSVKTKPTIITAN